MSERALVTPRMLWWVRWAAGLSRQDVAGLLGTDARHVRMVEWGITPPTIDEARKYADLAGVPLALLYLPRPPRWRLFWWRFTKRWRTRGTP